MNDPNLEEHQRQMEMVQRHAEQLGEHFDSVQVFCTIHDHGGGTAHFSYGTGNWYARYGQVLEWLNIQQGQAMDRGAESNRERGD